jgi:hypothetical protein
MNNFIPGKYRHYKGGEYEALFLAQHTEIEDEEMVVYKSISDGKIWTRPLSMWLETVKVEGKEIKRFTKLK